MWQRDFEADIYVLCRFVEKFSFLLPLLLFKNKSIICRFNFVENTIFNKNYRNFLTLTD